MISIIICSTSPSTSKAFLKNIQETIGTAYEVIHIDNSKNEYNIFQAYNLGVDRSKGDCLCFMHEDLVFHSHDWGKVVETHLANPVVGALGVAGGHIIPDQLDWRFYYDYGVTNIIQGSYSVEERPCYYHAMIPKTAKPHTPLLSVAIVDGLWICMRRSLFDSIRFDDEHFHDFHLYDSDICMQVNQQGKGIFVTYDVLIEHQSEGTFSTGYRESLKVFLDKWKSHLPLIRGIYITPEEVQAAASDSLKRFENRLATDEVIIRLRQLFKEKRQGDTVRPLTTDEQAYVDASAYHSRRRNLKDPFMSASEVWPLVRDYLHLPYATRKAQLLLKYIWYRKIKH